MAGSSIGLFLPSETAYKDPNVFRNVLEAEGLKRANYLSQMDQFYAQLEESKRQFDLGLSFQEKQLEAQKEHWSQQLALGREQLAEQSKHWRDELSYLRDQRGTDERLQRQQFNLQKKMWEFKEDQSRRAEDLLRSQTSVLSQLAGALSGSGGYIGTVDYSSTGGYRGLEDVGYRGISNFGPGR